MKLKLLSLDISLDIYPSYTFCLTAHIQTYLPQIKSKSTNVIVGVQFVIFRILWVVDLRMDPFALVVGVVNLLGFPFALQKFVKIIS